MKKSKYCLLHVNMGSGYLTRDCAPPETSYIVIDQENGEHLASWSADVTSPDKDPWVLQVLSIGQDAVTIRLNPATFSGDMTNLTVALNKPLRVKKASGNGDLIVELQPNDDTESVAPKT